MSTIPIWLKGRGVTTFSLTAQTADSAGVLSDSGSAIPLVGMWDDIDIEDAVETEEISASDAISQNVVVLKDAWSMRCTILLNSGATQPLTTLLGAHDYFKMILTRGGNTWTGYMVRTGYSEAIRKGRCVCSAQFGPLGLVPSYS